MTFQTPSETLVSLGRPPLRSLCHIIAFGTQQQQEQRWTFLLSDKLFAVV